MKCLKPTTNWRKIMYTLNDWLFDTFWSQHESKKSKSVAIENTVRKYTSCMSSMTRHRGVRDSNLARPLVTLFFLDITGSAEYIKSAPDHPSSYSAYFHVSNGLKVLLRNILQDYHNTKILATAAVFAKSHKLAGQPVPQVLTKS